GGRRPLGEVGGERGRCAAGPPALPRPTHEEGTMQRHGWWLGALAAVSLLASACAGVNDTKSSPSSVSQESARSAAGLDAGKQAPAAAQGSANAQSGSAAPLPALDRKIITNESLTLTVKDVRSAFQQIGLLAEASGGLVADSNLRQEGDQTRAT